MTEMLSSPLIVGASVTPATTTRSSELKRLPRSVSRSPGNACVGVTSDSQGRVSSAFHSSSPNS